MPDLDFIHRLHLCAVFAERVSKFYYRGIQKKVHSQIRSEAVDLLRNPPQLPPVPFDAHYAQLLMGFCLGAVEAGNVFPSYQKSWEEARNKLLENGEASPLIWETFCLHAREMDSKLTWKVDQWFSNYVKNHFFSKWYTDCPDIGNYLLKLLVKIFVVRTILIGRHTESPNSDALAVEVFQHCARSMEHSDALFDKIIEELNSMGLEGYSGAVQLIHLLQWHRA